MLIRFFLIYVLCVISALCQKYDSLALTPPMGWNSWNKFAWNVDEKLIRETADAMVASGMKDAGYQFVVIDDCWHGKRDSLGFIHPHPEHFPSGMKALVSELTRKHGMRRSRHKKRKLTTLQLLFVALACNVKRFMCHCKTYGIMTPSYAI